VVIPFTFSGLTVSYILKYAEHGAILKVVSSALAMVPVTLYSVVYTSAQVTPNFVLGCTTSFASLYLYFANPTLNARKPGFV
jgi:hypothetical protein